MHFLYILWAVEDELVKVGISSNWKLRLKTLGGAGNPLDFMVYKLFAFDEKKDAQFIETHLKRVLDKEGKFKSKKELFHVAPSFACDAVGKLCDRHKIAVIKNYPDSVEQFFQIGFSYIPEKFSEFLSEEEKLCYINGVRDTLYALIRFGKIEIYCQELASFINSTDFSESPTQVHDRIFQQVRKTNPNINEEYFDEVVKRVHLEDQQVWETWQDET